MSTELQTVVKKLLFITIQAYKRDLTVDQQETLL